MKEEQEMQGSLEFQNSYYQLQVHRVVICSRISARVATVTEGDCFLPALSGLSPQPSSTLSNLLTL